MLKWTTVQLSILPKTTFNVAEIINNVDISKNEILILLFGPKQVSSMTVATVKRKNFDMNDFQTEILLANARIEPLYNTITRREICSQHIHYKI